MGVTGLWNIVTPLSKVLALSELRGKTVAIDLSCWIVDSQTVVLTDSCPKKHLRSIFFRTVALLLNGVHPVFVLEGRAPILKHDLIRKRNEARKYIKEKESIHQATTKKGGRGNAFNATVKECETMLQFMGLSCVKAEGEAEAMCAYLNADGLVDGCITQDSDCFLYGAKTVYRNFTLNDKSGFGCAVEEYSLQTIRDVYNFGRNKMIALALLCGCDYGVGVPGVGKDGAMKWLQTVDDKDILRILKNWASDENFHKSMTNSVKGRDEGKSISKECQIRKKCMAVENFPNQGLIDEFVVRKGLVPSEIDKWSKPNVALLIEFLNRKLKWKFDYTTKKVIPILTRWNVTNLTNLDIKLSIDSSNLISPKRIMKIRNIQSISNYEIEWNICIDRMNLPDSINIENGYDAIKNFSTIEPQGLVNEAYPELVRVFEEAINASTKKASQKRKIRKNDGGDKKIDQYFQTKRIDVREVSSQIDPPTGLFKSKKKIKPSSALSQICGNRKAKNYRKRSPKLDNTMRNIYETLDEEDFITDIEEESMEMSLVVSRICESTDVGQTQKESTLSLVNVPKPDTILSSCISDISNTSRYNYSDEFDDNIPYVALDVRVKK